MKDARVVGSLVVALGLPLAFASPAAAARLAPPAGKTFTVPGYRLPGTPVRFNRVQVRRFGSATARKVLVLVPGTLAGAADFSIVGPYLASHVPNLQVWAEMRREGALEDNSMLLAARAGRATVQQAFDYYLGWLGNPQIKPHYQPLKNADFPFVKQWGLDVAMRDLRNVIRRARAGGRRTVVLGGHSLGGSEAAIYPAWDFNGHAGYKDIAGIVGIDGGPFSRPGAAEPSPASVTQQLAQMNTKGPFLDLLGAGLPWVTGPFAELGALAAVIDPHGPSTNQASPLIPSMFKPPVPATNAAQLGYAFDAATSPKGLALIQIHSGHLAPSGNPADWVDAGPTPVENLATAFAVEPLGPVDWYYPQRLSIDVTAAHGLTQTPAARTLGLHLWHRREVNVPYYVIQTSLGGAGNALATGALAYKRASRIPSLTIVDVSRKYSHLDPLLAAPGRNDFLRTVVPWLKKIKPR